MKIPIFILSAVLTIVIGLQAWMLSEIVSLKVEVATLNARIHAAGIAQR